MNNFTERLRKTLEKNNQDSSLDLAVRLAAVAFGLSILSLVIVLVKIALKL